VPTSLYSYSLREQFTDRHVILTSCQPVFALTHWENSSQIDMVSWLRANQSFLLLTERTLHRYTCYPDFVPTSLFSYSLREQFTDRHVILTSCQPVFALTHWENSSQIDMLSWLRAIQSLLLHVILTSCQPVFALTHWENSSQIDMLSWLRANQYLLLLTERTVHR
jgi:hypothetical protein